MPIYRFKLDTFILNDIVEFSSVHRYDDPETFREAWDEWLKDNNEKINREENRLKNIGYNGDVKVKMYKSARYYFKNKETKKSEPAKRRKYISISKGFTDKIDEHIDSVKLTLKPADGYTDFLEKNKSLISEEKAILNSKISDNEIDLKIKKTYKNRYFIKNKNVD
jgi:hypothetical protein|tara:strand:- start:2787 stop:3284 length:498 start_codon:yes stop_codon:yes gene_type:complete